MSRGRGQKTQITRLEKACQNLTWIKSEGKLPHGHHERKLPTQQEAELYLQRVIENHQPELITRATNALIALGLIGESPTMRKSKESE